MAYQWYSDTVADASSDGTAISGATSETYTPVLADVGKYIRRIEDSTKKSAKTKVIRAAIPRDTGASLFAHWKFDDLAAGSYSSFLDLGGNEFTLTPRNASGATTATVALVNGLNEVVLDGTKWLEVASGFNSLLKKLHDGTTTWTMMIRCRIGNASNPNAAYGVIGNNGVTSAARGFSLHMDNRTATPATRRLVNTVSNGSAFNIAVNREPIAELNKTTIIWVVFRPVNNQDNRTTQTRNLEVYSDGLLQHVNAVSSTSYSSSDPSYNLQLGACGNNSLPMTGGLHEVAIWAGEVSQNYRKALEAAYVWAPSTAATLYLEPIIRKRIRDNYYTLEGTLERNPVSGLRFSYYAKANSHTITTVPNRIIKRTKPATSATWGEETEIFTGQGYAGIYCGYDSLGRLYAIAHKFNFATGVRTGGVSNSGFVSRYSDDDGVTWSSEYGVTGIPTGLLVGHDHIIQLADGNMAMVAYHINGSTYGIYTLRSTDRGATWAVWETVYSGATYINECTLLETSAGKLLVIARADSVPNNVYHFDNFGGTWANRGNFSLGSGNTFAHPPRLRKVTVSGTSYAELTWNNRTMRMGVAVYAKLSGLETNNISEWTGRTRFQIQLPQERDVSGYWQILHDSGDALAGEILHFNEYGYTGLGTPTSNQSEIIYADWPANHSAALVY